MDPPRQTSPQWMPRPLQPSPWNTPQISPRSATPPDKLHDISQISLPYLSTVARPIREPNEIIHDYYNVSPVILRLAADGSIPHTVEMPLLNRADNRPTHVLAVLSSSGHSPSTTPALAFRSDRPSALLPSGLSSTVHAEPYLLPIDASVFAAKFGHDVARTLAASLAIRSAPPLVRWDRSTRTHLVTLPLISLYVPHPPSIPHLLLFGQALPLVPTLVSPAPDMPPSRPGFSTQSPGSSSSTLATYLLPVSAIEEFPSAPAMAEVMACQCSEDALRTHVIFNHGLWRNVLLLAPTDASLVDLARVAWNVTADARRIQRQRLTAGLDVSLLMRSPHGGEERELPAVNVQYADVGVVRSNSDMIHLSPAPPARRPAHQRSNDGLHTGSVPRESSSHIHTAVGASARAPAVRPPAGAQG